MIFQKMVLTAAIVILIIMLVIIGMSLSKASYEDTWPPIVGDCPDYWVDMSGNGEACLNSHSLGRCNIPTEGENGTMNFNQSPFTGDNGICSKYNWATGCGVTWDGITSGISNPCDTSTTNTST
jgi:hypothetical protein